jgi:DNA-binding NtrC family response regulator
MMLSRLLRRSGHGVAHARNAHEARTALEAQIPDLVISDIVMPGESGIELRRVIGRRWPHVPVILISGYSADGPVEFAARTPRTWFLQKPFATEDLLALVDTTIGLGGAETAPSH